MRPLVAHCYLGLGTFYRRTDQREQAWEHLIASTTRYGEMDICFWLKQAEPELRLNSLASWSNSGEDSKPCLLGSQCGGVAPAGTPPPSRQARHVPAAARRDDERASHLRPSPVGCAIGSG